MSIVSAPEDPLWLENKGAFGPQVKGPVARSEINTRATTHKRKLTEKGKAFIKIRKEKDCESVFRSLKKKIDYPGKLFEAPDTALETFLTAHNQIDFLKEKLVEAHELYDSLLETESEKKASPSPGSILKIESSRTADRGCVNAYTLLREVRIVESLQATFPTTVSQPEIPKILKNPPCAPFR